VIEDFRVAEPTGEGNGLLNPQGSRKLLEVVPLHAIAGHGEAGQVISQKRSRGTESKITSLPRN
jgi:hypothetical protein